MTAQLPWNLSADNETGSRSHRSDNLGKIVHEPFSPDFTNVSPVLLLIRKRGSQLRWNLLVYAGKSP